MKRLLVSAAVCGLFTASLALAEGQEAAAPTPAADHKTEQAAPEKKEEHQGKKMHKHVEKKKVAPKKQAAKKAEKAPEAAVPAEGAAQQDAAKAGE